MPNPQDTTSILVPVVLQHRLASLRLHPRMPYYEVIEAALDFWQDYGGWMPCTQAPVDGYEVLPRRRRASAVR